MSKIFKAGEMMKRVLALALAFVLVLGYIPVGVSAADGDYTVAGTFNGWSTTATPMTDNRNGTHTVTLPLAAGYYEFKVTDGTWNNNWGGSGPDGNYALTVVKDCDVTFEYLMSGEKASVLVDDKVTVYFVNTANWTNVYAYTWSDSELHLGAWGGTRMTKVAGNIWSVKIPAADASNIIFHNASGTQTGNLSVPYDGRLVYTYNSGWTTCASSHLMSNGTCQICGASCSHSSHGTDGNCSSCGLNVGHSYPSTGLCACGLQAEALVDDIQFASFDSAINVVSPGGTIKLLTDVTAGTVNGNNGHNLDLNGKTLTVDALWAPSTSFLRIQDSSAGETGKIVGDVYTSQYLYLDGGTIEGTVWLTSYSQLKGNFAMTGGAIKADTDLFINTDGAAVKLQGGEFIDGLKIGNNASVTTPMTLADTISSGYRFYQNGSVVDMTGVTDTISGSTVKVQSHTHAYSSTTGFCPCGDECAHSSKTNGVCDTCGMADAHTHAYVNGACSCGKTAQVLVTYSDSTTKYFDTLQDALDTFSKNNSFAYVKLLTHIAMSDNISADIYTHYTLDLNGYSLTAERLIVPASGGMEIMDSSVGQTGQVNAIVHAHGPLTIWSGTFNDTVLVTTMSNVKGSVTVRDGKFTAATDFQIADDDCSLSLWSGTFPGGIKVEAISGATKDELADFLYNNNSYFQDCEKVTLTAGQSEISSGHVVVAYDAKHQFGSNTKCSYCGLDAIVSMSLDGVTTYYGTVYDLRQDLVQENAGCTIQLLTDITTTYFADKDGRCGFYLDLNGHTLTASDGVSLPGSSGCTIMDTSAEKKGKIVGTVYAAYSTALTGGTIEGTVSFPKKASATGYTFQMEGGAIHADMDFGINDNNTTIVLTGGTFPGGISIACGDYVTTPMTLADCISGSYKYIQNGKVVTLTDGQTEITGGDVTIASHAAHTYEDGKCTGCGAECPHDTYSEGICDVCGRICPHSANTNGVCDECGESLAIQVSIGGQVGYYNDLKKAFEAVENCTAADNAQIKLLKDLENVPAISTWGGVVTLDMNGKSITGEADNYGSVLDFCNTTVTIIGDGSVNGAYGVLHVDVKANVTINSGTFTSNSGTTMVTLHGNCNVSINGGTFEGGIYTSNYTDGDAPKVEIGGTASVQGLSIYDGATVTINGGTFGGSKAITVEDGVTLTVNGGIIDGTDYEFYYYNAESADVTVNKASFPNDLKVNTPVLNQILGENAMYYKGSQTVKPLDTDTKITGAVTVDAHSHFASHYYNMVHPTCTEDGTKAYFLCEGCGKKFEDREATKELTDLTIPAEGHFFDENGFCTNIKSDSTPCGAYEAPEGEGTESSPYLIDNAGKLFWFAAVVNGGYEDTNGNSAAWATVTEDITIPEGMAWTPISGYRGTFDGGSKTISGMHCTSDAIYVGMFSRTGKCAIQNVYLSDSSFESTNVRGSVGAIAGYAGESEGNSTVISNCSISNTTVTGYTAGGIVGTLYGFSEIRSSNPNCTVNAEGEGGGAVGRCHSGTEIQWVSAQGTVTGNYAGGVVGYVVNDAGPYANRSNDVLLSTFTGTVGDENTTYAGGIIGYVSGSSKATIDNCSVKCNVTAEYSVNSRACGLLGHSNNGSNSMVSVSNSFTIDTTLNPANINKASLASGGATVTNCYSDDQETILTLPSVIEVNCAKKTDEQFKSGEVAYLLDAPQSTHAWGQNIDNGNMNYGFPVRGQHKVYQVIVDCAGTVGYSNTDEDKTAHDPVHVPEVSATCQAAGTIEHWVCDACSKLFAEESCTTEVEEEDLLKPQLAHSYTNGFCANVVDGAVCDAYEPAVLVTAENREELGLTEDYIGYYAITNAGQLYWFADKVDNDNANFGAVNVVLTDNITVNTGTITADSTGVRVWNPIGNKSKIFNGTFDGNGKTVSGMYFNDKSYDDSHKEIALIGCTGTNALVKNVTVTNSYFCGYYNVAGIVGRNKGTVTGCVNKAMMDCEGYSAGIVGDNQGNISNCFNYGTIYGGGIQGGIAGDNSGTVELCGNEGSISASWMHAGGIVGSNNGTIRNCWNTGDVYAKTNCAGGIAGSNIKNSGNTVPVVENCWSTGSITPTTKPAVGGIVGRIKDSSQNNCYSVMKPVGEIQDSSAQHVVENMEIKTLEQFASGEVAYLLGGVWGQDLDNGKTVQTVPTFDGADVYYGYINCGSTEAVYTNTSVFAELEHDYENGFCELIAGETHYEPAVLVTAENREELGLAESYIGYYAITNAGQLYWFAEQVDNNNANFGFANVVLTEDITVNSGTVTSTSTGLRQWTPIATEYADRYTGTFDGNGKTISGLFFNNSGVEYVGLFGCIGYDSEIKDVTLSNSYFYSEDYYVGGIVGNAGGGTITGCSSSATVVGGYFVGGIAATAFATISDCHNSGAVTALHDNVGGIVSRTFTSISDCTNSGAVTGSFYVGGIAGENYGGEITDCTNSGSVTGSNSYAGGIVGLNQSEGTITGCSNSAKIQSKRQVGGLVGRNDAQISNCYNTGDVEADEKHAGGLVGWVWSEASITNSYNTGAVTVGQEYAGGVAGDSDGTVTNCYYITGKAAGGINGSDAEGSAEGKKAEQFTSGEVAYLLRTNAVGTNVWGQDLDNGKTVQTVPTFDGADVYCGYITCADTAAKYTNDSTVSETSIPHDWEYTANAAQITAECQNGCGTDGGKVTLTAPVSTVYQGVEMVVVPQGALTEVDTLPQVTYEGDRVNVGSFTAKLTVGDATAQLPVQILPYELQIQTFVPEAKVYDGTTTCGIKSLSFVSTANGEELVLGTDFTAQLTFPSADAGEYTDVVMTVTLMDTALAGNYKLKTDTVTGITHTITPATITVANVQVENKIYDATTDAAVSAMTVSGIVTGDDVKMEARAAFADKNAGEDKAVTVTYTLTGADAGNYALAETTGTTTATITAATITVTNVQVENKVYDGTTDAAVASMRVSGIETGEDVQVETAGAFADKNCGEDKAVTVTYTLTGADAGNYALAETTGTTTATITAATITVTNVQVENKVYDGTTDAAVASMRVSGIVTGEDVKVETSAVFADENSGEDKEVTITYTLSGADAGNYALAETTGTTTASITSATITVTDVKVEDKVYDGTTDATVTGVTISGVVTGDVVSVNAEAAFADKNSGENKTVNLTYTLTGADAGNYALAETTGTTTASITAKALEDIMNPVKDLTVDNATSDDKDALEDVKKELEDVLTDEGLSDDDRKEREDALQDVQDMLDRIEEAGSAPDTDAVGDTLDTNADNVTPEDRENIEQALEDLKDALDEFGDNYTEEQKQAIQDAIDRLEEALEVLDQVQAVIDAIKALPEEVQPDAEEREDILAAKDAYDALSDRQKEMIPEELVQKLNDLLADLKLYVLTEGDGQTWSEGDLSFIANGRCDLFMELKIDGSTVAASNYTVVSGSTILTLKESYLETLTAGKHSIKFVYPDGEAVGSFTVVIPTNGSAGTGDEAPILLLAVMMSVSLAGAVMLLERKRKF